MWLCVLSLCLLMSLIVNTMLYFLSFHRAHKMTTATSICQRLLCVLLSFKTFRLQVFAVQEIYHSFVEPHLWGVSK